VTAAPQRVGEAGRTTAETDVTVRVTLDGAGEARVDTGVGFYDHILSQLARHAQEAMEKDSSGDQETGSHHTE
jgi:imidazoleglycerol-phosphate dehydratase